MYDQKCEVCDADFSIEEFIAAGLIELDKGSTYGEKGCYKCANTPLKRLEVCEKYIAANMVEDMDEDDRDKRIEELREEAKAHKKARQEKKAAERSGAYRSLERP